jgi:S-adenosylmethionine hydrolase
MVKPLPLCLRRSGNPVLLALLLPLFLTAPACARDALLVLQTDFGTRDGAVGAMKGAALGIAPDLRIHDLSHENAPYDIWEAAYRLKQTAPFWPKGTVFVSVVDPGVGTERRAVVLRTRTGHCFVGPDNGTFTWVADELGVSDLRRIDQARHRRKGAGDSRTFDGRDLFAVVGAGLASGRMELASVGPRLPGDSLFRIPYRKARRDGRILSGGIPVLDWKYGNVWTDIPDTLVAGLAPRAGDTLRIRILHRDKTAWQGPVPYAGTFGDVPEGRPLAYLNSLGNLSLAINMGDFAKVHGIGHGEGWSVSAEFPPRPEGKLEAPPETGP